MFTELFGFAISEGALDAGFRPAKPGADVRAILARLRRARVVCSDETSGVEQRAGPLELGEACEGSTDAQLRLKAGGRISELQRRHPSDPAKPGRQCCRGGHGRPSPRYLGLRSLWRPDGYADDCQICLAHQLRDCKFAIC